MNTRNKKLLKYTKISFFVLISVFIMAIGVKAEISITDSVYDTSSSLNTIVMIKSPFPGFVASSGFDVSVEALADSVFLTIKNKADGSIINLGKMEQVGSGFWRKKIDGTVLKNGNYYLQASSVYQNKEFRSEPISIVISLPEAILYTTSDAPRKVDSHVRFSFPTNGKIISTDEMKVEINALNAESIELLIREKNSTINKYIAQAAKVSSETWVAKINVSSYIPNGEYYLSAKMWDVAGYFKESVVVIKVDISDVPTDKKQEVVKAAPDEQVSMPLSESKTMSLSNIDSDGDEIRNGLDPLNYSLGNGGGGIVFESPRDTGTLDESYKVEKIELIKNEAGEAVLRFSGKAIPNSFVTIFIYSNPIIITLKTDANGDWMYELDKKLEEGEHEVYVAVTDNTGRIMNKSEPLRFINTAEAAIVIPNVQAQEIIKNQTPAQKSKNDFMLFAFLATVVFLSIALAAIGIINHRHVHENESD